MPETTGVKKESAINNKQPLLVSVNRNHLGHEINTPNSQFDLSNMFSPNAARLDRDKFTRVYFRTDSGNIYMLNDRGQLVNGNESKKRVEIRGIQLDKTWLEKSKLEVGEQFRYGNDSNTTTIVEIVPVIDQNFDSNYLNTLTKGRRNTIMDEFLHMLPDQKKTSLQVQEQALGTGMLYGKKDAVLDYSLTTNGAHIYTNRFEQNEFDALVKEFKHNPFTKLANARENIRRIMNDPQLNLEERQDRAKRYTDAYLGLTLKLDHAAYPADKTIRQGIPDYLPDGLVDMGSDPDAKPHIRSREKIKVDKAKIFEQAKPLFYKIFTEQIPPDISPEKWEKWVITHVAAFVYERMPYNHAGKKHEAQYGRSIGLHEIIDHKLAQCRHHALMTQVLLQSFGIESRLMKSDFTSDEMYLGAHANNAVRVGDKWFLLDSTNPDVQPDGTGKVFAKPLPESNLDLNANTYKWDFQKANGGTRQYKSRSNMYWYLRTPGVI